MSHIVGLFYYHNQFNIFYLTPVTQNECAGQKQKAKETRKMEAEGRKKGKWWKGLSQTNVHPLRIMRNGLFGIDFGFNNVTSFNDNGKEMYNWGREMEL